MLKYQKDYSISFCITCMNRAFHIQRTLPDNIQAAKDSGCDCEFILLNYNSTDHLDQWVRENLSLQMDEGIVKYYKTTDRGYYDQAHAKNVAHLLGSKELLCNLDADNILTHKYIDQVYSIFRKGKEYVTFGASNAGGRICLHRDYFYQLGGYNEELIGYGRIDADFYKRAVEIGLTKTKTADSLFIEHDHKMRTVNIDPKLLQKALDQTDYEGYELRPDVLERISKKPKAIIATTKYNSWMTWRNIKNGVLRANQGKEWGHAKVVDRNGKEFLVTHN